MEKMTYRELRDNLADALNRIEYQGARIVVTRRGRPVARITPYEEEPAMITIYNHPTNVVLGKGSEVWDLGPIEAQPARHRPPYSPLPAVAGLEGMWVKIVEGLHYGYQDWGHGRTPAPAQGDLAPAATWSEGMALRLEIPVAEIAAATRALIGEPWFEHHERERVRPLAEHIKRLVSAAGLEFGEWIGAEDAGRRTRFMTAADPGVVTLTAETADAYSQAAAALAATGIDVDDDPAVPVRGRVYAARLTPAT